MVALQVSFILIGFVILLFLFLLFLLFVSGLTDIFENLTRNTRLLDNVQRSVNLLLQDRDRILQNLRSVTNAIKVEGQEELRGIFGNDHRVTEYFKFLDQADAVTYRSSFHRELPSNYSYDRPEAGPSGTQH